MLAGLFLNKWTLQEILVSDGIISSIKFIAAVGTFQVSLFLSGLWVLLKRPALWVPAQRVGVVGLLAAVSVGAYASMGSWTSANTHQQSIEEFRAVYKSEELIQSLAPELKGLVTGVMNLEFPDRHSYHLFEDQVSFIDLDYDTAQPTLRESFPTISTRVNEWQISGEAVSSPVHKLRGWRNLLDDVDFFEHADFKIKKGHFLDPDQTEYETLILFSGMAQMNSGHLLAVDIYQTAVWRKQSENSENGESLWRIYDWRTVTFEITQTEQTPFVEVLDNVIVNGPDLARARESIHEDLVTEYILNGNYSEKPHKSFLIPSNDRHPGISVVDLNRDGLDDIYVMARWGKNMFFRNRGDGTFKQIAAEIGLDIKDHTSSAIFADFDNDGDTDAFLGRTLARSIYLVNEGGRLFDRSDILVDSPLPFHASAISAVDYNSDGLLDIYISTYAATKFRAKAEDQGAKQPGWANRVLNIFRDEGANSGPNPFAGEIPQHDVEHLDQLIQAEEYNLAINRPGPPNVLLKNVGSGRFEIVQALDQISVFRNTYQATWADFDGDGDPDVYLANDYAPNNLLRNEGGGEFIDITEETGTEDVGFGMGATWGDYDNDGSQDLYVTNMYSSAGRRITDQLSQLDPRFRKSARGNSLFRYADGDFDKVSGLLAPEMMVENGGWGWGSQFVDFDNDGFLDLYAPSGYYTAPKPVAIPVDI
ncbi:MAG: FG-GAP repeat domain-containing protein [Dehalococcoidia bacterium]